MMVTLAELPDLTVSKLAELLHEEYQRHDVLILRSGSESGAWSNYRTWPNGATVHYATHKTLAEAYASIWENMVLHVLSEHGQKQLRVDTLLRVLTNPQ